MTEFKVGDEVWVKGVINQINKGDVWDLYISTRENGVWIDSRLDECIPQNDTDEKPRYLRNVLARLRGLPEHDRKVWMDEIMHEFANDYGSVKYTLGYEQGKFDGAVEAEKSNKVIIPQFVAKWIDYCKFTHVDLQHALVVGDVYFYNYANQKDFSKLKEFLETENNQELFARAWLDGYRTDELEELWKPIDGFYNEVSNFGRVRSVTHEAGNGKIYQGKILKPVMTKSGYVNVPLVTGNDETRVTKRVHRLVADAFCKNPDDKDEINHKDGNKENNRAENLEWVTRSENEQHAYANNLVKVLKGSKKPCAKLNEEDIRHIRIEYENGCLQIELAERYGVARQTISSIVNRKAWSHVQ